MDQIRPSASTPLSSLSLDQSRQAGKKPTMDQVGKAFESLFMQSMMKSMRDAQIEGGLLESEHSKPFQSMLDGIYSEMAVKRTNLGLADAIKRQFLARSDNKVEASDGAQQVSFNSARSASISSGLQMNVGGSSSALGGPVPIGDLSSSLAAQQAASLKTTRPASNHINIPRAVVVPKISTGD
jgi:flagellar protein FlgJ